MTREGRRVEARPRTGRGPPERGRRRQKAHRLGRTKEGSAKCCFPTPGRTHLQYTVRESSTPGPAALLLKPPMGL